MGTKYQLFCVSCLNVGTNIRNEGWCKIVRLCAPIVTFLINYPSEFDQMLAVVSSVEKISSISPFIRRKTVSRVFNEARSENEHHHKQEVKICDHLK